MTKDVIPHPVLPGHYLVGADVDLHVDSNLHDLFPGNPRRLHLPGITAPGNPSGERLEPGVEPPGQEVSAGEEGGNPRRLSLAQLQHHAVHLPYVDVVAVDQLLIQNFPAELHVSLPSVAAEWPPGRAPKQED